MAGFKCFWTLFVVLIGGLVVNAQSGKDKPIKVVGVIGSPYLMKNEEGFFEGFIPDLIDRMTADMSANYSLYNVSVYGRQDEDGTWSGMIGELINKKADVAIMLTVTHRRAQFIDFSYPVTSAGPSIVLKRPPKERMRITDNIGSLFRPFDFTVWLMTILAFFVTSTALYMISHFNPYEWRRMFKDREATLREAESFTCMNSFWFSISTMTLQGYVRAPRSVGGRIVVTAWWFFVLLLLLSYVASLTNLLRVGPKPLEAEGYSKIRGFSDLAKSNNIKVLVLPNGSTQSYFKTSGNTQEATIYKKMVETQEVDAINSIADAIQKIRESPFADMVFVMESNTAKYLTQQQPCDIYMVSDSLITAHQAFAFRKGSNLTALFNDALLKLREDGTLRALENKWFPSYCENSVVDYQESGTYEFQRFYKLDLGAFFGAVLILGLGLILGGFATVVEVCIYKWAETHVDEDEIKVEPEANNGLMEDSAVNRGGATQV